jgi:hypothetical protein
VNGGKLSYRIDDNGGHYQVYKVVVGAPLKSGPRKGQPKGGYEAKLGNIWKPGSMCFEELTHETLYTAEPDVDKRMRFFTLEGAIAYLIDPEGKR